MRVITLGYIDILLLICYTWDMEYTKEDEVRFWSKVNVSKQKNGCWTWRDSKHPYGYGYFRINKKTYLAHRLSLVLFYGGKEEQNKQALHSCDNPTCCNPYHLRWGTPKNNVEDAIKRHRKTDPPTYHGEKHPKAKLNWEKVDEIRKSRIDGEPMKNLAKKYDVSINTIYRIISYQNWDDKFRKEGSI